MTSSTATLPDGTRLACRELGEGRPVLLHPGFALTRELWAPLMAELAEDHRCIAFDPRGHGASDSPAGRWTIERLAEDLAELADVLDLRDATLVGHSLGGAVACTAVLDFDAAARFSRLVLLGPAVPGFVQRPGQPFGAPRPVFDRLLGEMTDDFVGTSRRTAEIFFHQADPEAGRAVMEAGLRMRPEVAAELFAQLGEIDLADRLDEIPMPVLALWGRHDTLSDPRWAGWFEDLELPGWRTGILEHSAHGSMLDEPEELASRIRAFEGLESTPWT